MNSKRVFICDFIYDLFFGLIFCAIFGIPGAAVIMDTQLGYVWGLLFMLPFFTCAVMRKYLQSFFLLAFSHITFFGALVALSYAVFEDATFTIVSGEFAVCCIIYSFVIRLRAKTRILNYKHIILAAAILVVASITAVMYAGLDLNVIYTVIFGIIILVYFVFKHIHNLDSSLQSFAITTLQPVEHIISFNNKVLITCTVSLAVILLIAGVFRADWIMSVILWFLGGIVWLVVQLLGMVEKPEGGRGSMFSITQPWLPDTGKELPQIIPHEILQAIFITLTVVGIVLFIIYSIYKMVIRFNATSRTAGADTYESLIHERIRIKSAKPKFSIRNLVFKTNGEKVRRMFYNKVREYSRKKVPFSLSETSSEMSDKIKSREDVALLNETYKKARYGYEAVTDADMVKLYKK